MIDKTVNRGVEYQQLQAILTATVDAVVTIDAAGKILSTNAAGLVLFGYTEEELVGQAISILMPHVHKQAEEEHLQLFGRSSLTSSLRTVRSATIRRKNGEIFPARLMVFEIEDEGNTFYSCIAHDLSVYGKSKDTIEDIHQELTAQNEALEETCIERTNALEKSNQALAEANDRLEKEIAERKAISISLQQKEVQLKRLLNKEREIGQFRNRFVSMASHEFRTPLTTMLSSIEIIEMAVKNGPAVLYKHTSRIRESIGYLKNILEDFLHLGKLDVKGTDLLIQEVNLKNFFNQMTDDLNLMCRPGQDIDLRIDDEIHVTNHSLNGIRICITNLLTNAIKYSAEGAAIDLDVSKQDERLIITVKDEGIGIPDGEIEFLFNRFFRASNAEITKGTGLGLYILDRYVKAMRGTVHAHQNPGRGTTFIIDIPFDLTKN